MIRCCVLCESEIREAFTAGSTAIQWICPKCGIVTTIVWRPAERVLRPSACDTGNSNLSFRAHGEKY